MDFKKTHKIILGEIAQALDNTDETETNCLAYSIMDAKTVFLFGVGRSFLSLQAFCKRLNHLGVNAYCVGDLNEPAITENDLLIIGSGSGETVCPVQIARTAKKYDAKVAHIGSNPQSSLKQYADIFVRIPVKTKLNLPDELNSAQIMSSLFEQSLYILCDSICMMIANEKNLDLKSLWKFHANLE
ncbi:MAG: SIS domain-containing protein [Oscillospiraceae bacterium]|nr:SIS domain-containing protein [Oscillospiraceae bacterium]